jgi:hypothetical protein
LIPPTSIDMLNYQRVNPIKFPANPTKSH